MYGGGGQSGHYIVFLYTGYPGTGHLDPPTSLGLATPLVVRSRCSQFERARKFDVATCVILVGLRHTQFQSYPRNGV